MCHSKVGFAGYAKNVVWSLKHLSNLSSLNIFKVITSNVFYKIRKFNNNFKWSFNFSKRFLRTEQVY